MEAQRLAIQFAERGRGWVSPNPLVGCVIVDKDHCFLSAGAHEKFGGPHAEVQALNRLQDKTQLLGATVYVTLEPCSHFGKTPPCADALVQYPIGKVVYGLKDPNPAVAGRGLQRLRGAGVPVESSAEFQAEAVRLMDEYLHLRRSDLPFVAVKLASSWDGSVALANGHSQWITGEEARTYSRQLRAHCDGTLIGAGTLASDNPRLDFRDTPFENKKRNKIVLFDPKGQGVGILAQSHLFKHHGPENLFVLSSSRYKKDYDKLGIHFLPWDGQEEAWAVSLKELRVKGMNSIFVEGGAKVIGDVFKARLHNKVFLFLAPKILGRGKMWSPPLELSNVDEALQFSFVKNQNIGSDLLLTAWV